MWHGKTVAAVLVAVQGYIDDAGLCGCCQCLLTWLIEREAATRLRIAIVAFGDAGNNRKAAAESVSAKEFVSGRYLPQRRWLRSNRHSERRPV